MARRPIRRVSFQPFMVGSLSDIELTVKVRWASRHETINGDGRAAGPGPGSDSSALVNAADPLHVASNLHISCLEQAARRRDHAACVFGLHLGRATRAATVTRHA
jgi:hypothetical protein